MNEYPWEERNDLMASSLKAYYHFIFSKWFKVF